MTPDLALRIPPSGDRRQAVRCAARPRRRADAGHGLARTEACKHLLRGAVKPVDPHAQSALHPADECLPEEGRQSKSTCCHSASRSTTSAAFTRPCASARNGPGISGTVRDLDWVVGMINAVAPNPNRPARYNQAKAVEGEPTNRTISLAMADALKPMR